MKNNSYIYEDKRLRLSVLNSLLSWLNHMAYSEIDKPYKDCDNGLQLIFNIERYYNKYKMVMVKEADLKFLTNRLKMIQKTFEDSITIGDKDENGIYPTVKYSNMLLSILALDYLVNVEKDLSLRNKFGHIDFLEIFKYIEKVDKELYYRSLKIFNELVGRI